MSPVTLVWFRDDLRIFDHAALQEAVRLGLPVVGLFVWEEYGDARRARFLYECLSELEGTLADRRVPLCFLRGKAEEAVLGFAKQAGAAYVVCAESAEPAVREQDAVMAAKLVGQGCFFRLVNDAVLLPKSALVSPEGSPYTDFDSYRGAWLAAAKQAVWCDGDDWGRLDELQKGLSEKLKVARGLPAEAELGITGGFSLIKGGERAARKRWDGFQTGIAAYREECAFPARQGTSGLSPYLRFGALSVRRLVDRAAGMGNAGAQAWLDGLIRREYYRQLFYHYPNLQFESYKLQYRDLAWENRPDFLSAWQEGRTGYPLLDAAMRCLNQTGLLHGALRRFAAVFLTQMLLCDWRLGESYFAEQLLDYDAAVNNGCWQDAAGVGTERVLPRMVHPVLESQKLDPDGQIIRRYLPQLSHLPRDVVHAPWLAKGTVNTYGYSDPIVDYGEQKGKWTALFGV